MEDLVKISSNEVNFFGLPAFCVFPECGQLKDVYKIFLNIKVKKFPQLS